eukprot:m.30900 g.30900  ORF g.30900 m.30900 type:complete len:583 (-) comp12014_c0_seq1:95-1843(-)
MAARKLLFEDGVFHLRHPASSQFDKATFTSKVLPNGRIILWHLLQAKPGSLRILPSGHVDLNGGEGKWAQFTPVFHDDGTVSFKNFGNEGKVNLAQATDWYLGYDSSGDITGRASLGPESHFKLVALSFLEKAMVHMYRQGADVAKDAVFMEDVDLTLSQKQHFVEQGFVHVPNVIPDRLIDDALKVINAQLLTENSMEYNNLGHLVLAGGVGHSPEIKRLLYASPAYTLAQRLVGRGRLNRPGGGQVALRAPEPGAQHMMNGKGWHIDGMETKDHSSFTLLLGVTLSDCLEDYSGNFTVFPGSHRVLSEDLQHLVHNNRPAATIMNKEHKRDFGKPVQVKSRRGDIVMAHHKLAHRGGANYSPNIRYQIYFRLHHTEHDALKLASLSDIFIEFEGLRNLPPPATGGPPRPASTPWSQIPDPSPTVAGPRPSHPSSVPPPVPTPQDQPRHPVQGQSHLVSGQSPTATRPPAPQAINHSQPSARVPPAYPAYPVYPPAPVVPGGAFAHSPAPGSQPVATATPLPHTMQRPPPAAVPQGTQAYTQDLKTLTDMGFSQEQAQRALQACHGQLAPALDALLEGRVL